MVVAVNAQLQQHSVILQIFMVKIGPFQFGKSFLAPDLSQKALRWEFLLSEILYSPC